VPDELVHVRYMVDDVEEAVDFYTTHFGFTLRSSAAPAFADVVRGNLRLLLSGPKSSAGRPMPDGRAPQPGGWNRIHFVVEDIAAEVERLRSGGVTFRNDIISGPGGRQILLDDPAGNPIELFQPAGS
jgi:catechol 2,3-dioxygenase-like lactoylglutathione lyase family enzyme